jgi:intracellular sulfur oxidation DsrE/DsrF family protein
MKAPYVSLMLQLLYMAVLTSSATLANTYDVEFLVCGVGLRKHGLEKKDIYDFVKIIPTSTIGLIDKQNEGYAYVPLRD